MNLHDLARAGLNFPIRLHGMALSMLHLFFSFHLIVLVYSSYGCSCDELSEQLHWKGIACVSWMRDTDCFAVDHVLRAALQFKKLSLLAVAFSLSKCGG